MSFAGLVLPVSAVGMERVVRSYLIALCGASLALSLSCLVPNSTAWADSTPSGDPHCAEIEVPTGDLEIAGTLCSPPGRTPRTVMVLVPGATYNARYWDVGIQPEVYNFRLAMNRAGYSTVAVDRLGTGRSPKPASPSVTIQRQSDAVHALIGALRAGLPGHARFSSVILGAHSLGSTIAVTEAAQYRDADAVLLTGFSHAPNPVGLGALFATLVPAATERRFSGRDPGYLTTRPGTRQVLYGRSDVTPQVAAYDEETKDVVSAAEVPGAVGMTLPAPSGLLALDAAFDLADVPSSNRITAPVLLVDGSEDRQFCQPAIGNCTDSAALAVHERPYFGHSAAFEARTIAGSGHDLNLSTTTPQLHAVVLDWARRTVSR
jgi:pimeloyl-ACP methyl ester carboxylesterase